VQQDDGEQVRARVQGSVAVATTCTPASSSIELDTQVMAAAGRDGARGRVPKRLDTLDFLSAGGYMERSSWRCVRRRCQRRVCGLQQSYIPVPPSLPGHGSARTSPRHRVHPHSATRRKAPRTRPSSPCPHSLPKHSSSGRDGASTPTSPCASSSHLLTTQLRQSSTCVGGGDSHRSLNTSTIGMHVKDSCTQKIAG